MRHAGTWSISTIKTANVKRFFSEKKIKKGKIFHEGLPESKCCSPYEQTPDEPLSCGTLNSGSSQNAPQNTANQKDRVKRRTLNGQV